MSYTNIKPIEVLIPTFLDPKLVELCSSRDWHKWVLKRKYKNRPEIWIWKWQVIPIFGILPKVKNMGLKVKV